MRSASETRITTTIRTDQPLDRRQQLHAALRTAAGLTCDDLCNRYEINRRGEFRHPVFDGFDIGTLLDVLCSNDGCEPDASKKPDAVTRD